MTFRELKKSDIPSKTQLNLVFDHISHQLLPLALEKRMLVIPTKWEKRANSSCFNGQSFEHGIDKHFETSAQSNSKG